MKNKEIPEQEEFIVGNSNLLEYYQKLTKLDYGILMFCERGEAFVTINLTKYHIVQNANIFILTKSIISVESTSEDFDVSYFRYSANMFRAACFRIEPAFIHFINENPYYLPENDDNIKPMEYFIKMSFVIYEDKENRFRNEIAQNLLQIFIWDTYDKVQRLFTEEQINGSNRKEELFKKFLGLIHENCAMQRDVAWYASQLCISTRYLASIVRKLSDKNTAKEIIDVFSILEIKVMLQTTNLTIKEIADHFNFPDQSFFGRYFKKHTGISPTEFRQLKPI